MAITTKLCELLGIEHPIVQGALGPWSSAELSAAISNAGALGSIGTAAMPPQRVRELLARMGELTDRPFCLNHTARPFVEESWRFGIEARPKLISYAIGDPGELPKRAHEAGILFMAQVHTPQQAELAAERGADAIVAQGAEAGGFCGRISTMALVPQVVDAVAPIPVLAAGGIADGRGLAAALALGAAGINIGTRFLSSEESPIRDSWRRRILEATRRSRSRLSSPPAPCPAPRAPSTLRHGRCRRPSSSSGSAGRTKT